MVLKCMGFVGCLVSYGLWLFVSIILNEQGFDCDFIEVVFVYVDDN